MASIDDFPLTDQFTDGEDLNAVDLNARITARLNDLYAANPFPQELQLGRNIAWTTGNDNDEWITFYNESVLFSAGDQITNPGAGILTTTVSGLWRWSATVIWDACTGAADHRREVKVRRNGATPAHHNGEQVLQFGSGDRPVWTMSAGGPIQMDAADTLQLGIHQNTGASLDATAILFALEKIA